jgi:arginase
VDRPEIALLGVPIDCIGRPGGTELAPMALRTAGVRERLTASDVGDVKAAIRGSQRDPTSGVLALPSVVATIGAVRTAVEGLLRDGRWPLLLAGDCTATIGACAALRDRLGGTGLVYLDGHIDLYDGRTSPTGESADFPLAVVCGRGPAELRAAAGGADPIVDPARVALLGPRDRDQAESHDSLMPEDLDRDLLFLDAEAVRETGPAAAGARGTEHAAAGTAGFWLHLDLDVLGEDEFPATDYLMPGGLSWDELAEMLEPLVRSPDCRGMTVACFNPENDQDGRYATRIADLLGTALTERRG